MAKPERPVQLWNARPGVPIAAVFATEDGSAVVSIDESNHARLWPALDGTREPYVLPIAMTTEAVIERDGDGFAIAARDTSGGIEIVTVTSTGELTTHVKLPPDPGFDAVIEHGDGFLALGRDQRLVQFDRRGEQRAVLSAPAGEHVMKLVHRSDRTLALVRTKEGIRGHWLAPDALGWGDATPKLAVKLDTVAMSPDHKRLVTFSDARGEAMLVDLESGRSTSFVGNDSDHRRPEDTPLGFATGQRLVFGFNDFELSELQWWTVNGNAIGAVGGANYALEFVTVSNAVVTDTNVIAFSGHELAIATLNTATSPSTVRFLGYRTRRVKSVKTSPAGVMASIGSVARLLDDRVRMDKRMPALDTIPLAKDLALIRFTTSDWGEPVVNVSNGIDPDWLEDPNAKPKLSNHSSPRIALFDLDRKKELQRWPLAKAIRFEPTTQLMAIDRGNKVMFARFDAATRKFVDDKTFATSVTDIALLDPKLAGDNVAMLVRERGATVEVRTLQDLQALPAASTLTGKLEAIDRAGHIYLRVDPDTIVVRAGERETRITGMTGWTLRPSPTGAQIIALSRSRLMLLDERGETVWSVGFPGVSDAAWTPDGGLVVLAGDLAKVDVATGRVVAAQCGWGFGLRTTAAQLADVPSTTETLCDQ